MIIVRQKVNVKIYAKKFKNYRVLKEQSKRDRIEEERTLANNENRVRHDLLTKRKEDVENAKRNLTNSKVDLSNHIVNRVKTLADLRKKQYSDRQFVRGRFWLRCRIFKPTTGVF